MKQYLVKFKDGSESKVWASNEHNAKEISIGAATYSSGKSQDYWREKIVSVTLISN